MNIYGEGLGYEIVKAINNKEIMEPITVEKVRKLCLIKDFSVDENYINVVLSESTENSHSPTYKKYFKRIGIGEYEILDEYRENYYWLNVDSEEYGWSFSDLDVGKSQEYSNLNPDGSIRKNKTCFQNIKLGDKVVAYESNNIKAITAICIVVNKRNNANDMIVEFKKITDFNEFLTLKEMKATALLADCKIVMVHMGTLLKLERKHFDIIKRILEEKNSPTYIKEFDKAVNESLNLSDEERRRRLESNTNTIPEKTERTSSVFKRNPDVVAEILVRAKGKCEKCGKQAPFNRASDGTPYLEVHHKIWLAQGGEDTVENAIAVCPNCHRELHFG